MFCAPGPRLPDHLRSAKLHGVKVFGKLSILCTANVVERRFLESMESATWTITASTGISALPSMAATTMREIFRRRATLQEWHTPCFHSQNVFNSKEQIPRYEPALWKT